MKKNKQLVTLGILMTLLYICLVAFYLWNIQSLPGRYEKAERQLVERIQESVEEILNEYPISTSQLDQLKEINPLDIVVSKDNQLLYKSSDSLTEENFFTSVNDNVALYNASGVINSNGIDYNIYLRVYQMPDDRFIVPFLKSQITLIASSFMGLILGLFILIYTLLGPLGKIKKSIGHLEHYEFDKIESGSDEINRRFSDVSTRIEDNMGSMTKEYSKFERELEYSRQHINNTLLVSRSFIHDLKTPIHQQLMTNEIVFEEGNDKHTAIEVAVKNVRLSENLMSRVNEVLRILNEDMANLDEKIETIDLIELTYGSLRTFTKPFNMKHLSVEMNTPETLHIQSNKVILQLIIHNLLSNIGHYARPNTNVTINVSDEGDSVLMTYRNESTEENIERMRRSEVLFNVIEESTDNRFSSRNGLFLINDLTQMINGKYSYETFETATAIHVRIPKTAGGRV